MTEIDNNKTTQDWLVYIILCDDDSLYTGITKNITKRWQQHLNQTGAKYFRGRAPKVLAYLESGHDRGSASRREAAIKKLTRTNKIALIDSDTNEVAEETIAN